MSRGFKWAAATSEKGRSVNFPGLSRLRPNGATLTLDPNAAAEGLQQLDTHEVDLRDQRELGHQENREPLERLGKVVGALVQA